MSEANKMREWATPVTMGAFLLTGLTGVLMFFKINVGLVRPVHEWLSWLLVIGSVFHLCANWPAAKCYLARPVGRAVLAVFALLLLCTLLVPGHGGEGPHGRPQLGQAPVAGPNATAAPAPAAPSPARDS